jgi:mRNA interferase RelE/StbE
MKIVLSPRAAKDLRRLPKFDQLAIAKKIRLIASVKTIDEEKLSGFKDIFRIRVGNYRIVYRRQKQEIYLILIHHRRDVYKILRQLLD